MRCEITTMKQLYLYHGAFAVLGLSFLLHAVASYVVGDWGFVPLIFAVSGSGLILSSSYESLCPDPSKFAVSAGALFLIGSAACLSLILNVLVIVVSL
ncbi:hypothetical protein DJ83_18125 [Halorubrum ezzemoulense]|uniref:Uncharacterized protein n=1 Tax=Halorubrum ezzemoulense TaxID=337243 RepID=A0A256IKE8_HALEZ|nr:hypothetical protein DJ83_18125 [Halorubrum ezzemoulense]